MNNTLSETDIFTPNLKEQFFRELKPRLGELDLEKTYTLTLFFDEYCLLDREQMDAFVIPREALPRVSAGSGDDRGGEAVPAAVLSAGRGGSLSGGTGHPLLAF